MKACVGIDLTQHAPLVAKAMFPIGKFNPATLRQHWPPAIELHTGFCRQPPVCLLPVMHGEPPIVGDAAARHRRAAGLPWPPEAQVPYGGDKEGGIGRIPLLAAWSTLVPPPGQEEFMSRRADREFGWQPRGRYISVCAGQMIALSIREFLRGAKVDTNDCRVVVVVPDALDEAGQQILLDACSEAGLDTDTVHLLPRPLATALYWCHSVPQSAIFRNALEDEEGQSVGRLRVLATSMDVWEALSLEVRARRYMGRVWLIPMRDRSSVMDARPELGQVGISLAVTLAGLSPSAMLADWWLRLFASPWVDERLQRNTCFSLDEARNFQAVIGGHLPDTVRRCIQTLAEHSPICKCFGQDSLGVRPLSEGLWEKQEQLLGIKGLPLLDIVVDGTFSKLLVSHVLGLLVRDNAGPRMRVHSEAAVRGAALAAAATAHGLPCYREKLLPLDLCVRDENEDGDPVLQWKQLIAATSVEAGGIWRSAEPVTGLKIKEGQNRLILPLRRCINEQSFFRSVTTELTQPAERGEAVRVKVEVRPGQGFARVHIESITPGVFAARLDWRTMEKCDEPKPELLAYIPDVSRIRPDDQMFEQAKPAMLATIDALVKDRPDAHNCLRELIRLLNKWPLAQTVDRQRGLMRKKKDFKDNFIHYGVIGSDGKLEELPEPDLARRLRNLIGKQFGELVQAGDPNSPLGKSLLRAAGWFYLAMPGECYDYLRKRIRHAERGGTFLSAVELHAIGLAFDKVADLNRFYSLVVHALQTGCASYNWLRAVRNICRFRNHALSPDAISDATLTKLVDLMYSHIREQVQRQNFGRILANCLETLPFLLKRRRYDRAFLAPAEEPAVGIIEVLKGLQTHHCHKLPKRLQEFPRTTVTFILKQATESDIEALLGVEQDADEND